MVGRSWQLAYESGAACQCGRLACIGYRVIGLGAACFIGGCYQGGALGQPLRELHCGGRPTEAVGRSSGVVGSMPPWRHNRVIGRMDTRASHRQLLGRAGATICIASYVLHPLLSLVAAWLPWLRALSFAGARAREGSFRGDAVTLYLTGQNRGTD